MERAAFLIEDGGGQVARARISCLLNPNRLLLRRVAGLRPRQSLGGVLTQEGLSDDPLLQTGGGVTELRLDLLFDVNLPETWVTMADSEAQDRPRDVRDLTQPLWALAENQPRPGAVAGPPQVRFVWGKVWDFPGHVAAVAERFECFAAEGVPQRSFLRMRLLRASERPTAGPATRASATPLSSLVETEAERSPLDARPQAEQVGPTEYETTISTGLPLFLAAFRLYGDESKWRLIANANPDVDPLFVPAGTALKIPGLASTGGRRTLA
jgi:hypothetical protein